MIEIIGTFATCLAVSGVIFNNRKMRICFFIWIASNAISASLHWYAGIWSLVGRDVIFIIFCVEGYIRWGKKA